MEKKISEGQTDIVVELFNSSNLNINKNDTGFLRVPGLVALQTWSLRGVCAVGGN